jgi:hypothetical protein
MKCDGCEFAEWDRTKAGRLHPSGVGQCKRLEKQPLDLRLPVAFFWHGWDVIKPGGGYIRRGQELPRICVFRSVKP